MPRRKRQAMTALRRNRWRTASRRLRSRRASSTFGRPKKATWRRDRRIAGQAALARPISRFRAPEELPEREADAERTDPDGGR